MEHGDDRWVVDAHRPSPRRPPPRHPTGAPRKRRWVAALPGDVSSRRGSPHGVRGQTAIAPGGRSIWHRSPASTPRATAPRPRSVTSRPICRTTSLVAPRSMTSTTTASSFPSERGADLFRTDAPPQRGAGRQPVGRRFERDVAAHDSPVRANPTREEVRDAEETRDLRRRRRAEDLSPAPGLQQAPVRDDHHLRREQRSLLRVVGDEDGGDPSLALELAQLPAEIGAHRRVERRERLVEQEEPGRTAERLGEADPLTLAARELARQSVLQPRETEPTQPVAAARRGSAPAPKSNCPHTVRCGNKATPWGR